MTDLHSTIFRWRWISAFLALAQCGSQTAAARKLGCSQPTVHSNVAALEAWLGFSLGSGHSPYVVTEAGANFIRLAKKITRNMRRQRMNPDEDLSDFSFFWIDTLGILTKYKSQYLLAKYFKYSQSKVSRTIRDIENWLGYSVFERSGKYEITDLGWQFLKSAQSSSMRLHEFRSNVLKKYRDLDEQYEREMENYTYWLIYQAAKKRGITLPSP